MILAYLETAGDPRQNRVFGNFLQQKIGETLGTGGAQGMNKVASFMMPWIASRGLTSRTTPPAAYRYGSLSAARARIQSRVEPNAAGSG
jgi:hypothetical protein